MLGVPLMTDSMSKIENFDFNGQGVRVTVIDGDPWFVANDVGDVLGIRRSAVRESTRSLPHDFIRVISIGTNRGPRNHTIISYEGVTKMMIRSRKPEAEPFQDWISFEVVPSIRKNGYYFSGPKTNAERLLAQSKMLHDSMKELVEHERQLEEHDCRIRTIEQRYEEGERQLLSVERCDQLPEEKTTRAKINELQRAYCWAKNQDHRTVWNKIYSEITYRYHIDLRKRAKNSGLSALDYAEREGLIDKVYAVASVVCV